MMKLIERVKNILLSPKEEWLVIDQETTSVTELITTYLIPLAFIPAICSFIGYGIVGHSVPFIGHVPGSISSGVNKAGLAFFVPILSSFFSAYILSVLAPSFSSLKDFTKSFQLVTYAYTPILVAGVFYAFPSLGIFILLGIVYAMVILYLGFTPLLKSPEDKVTAYFVVGLVTIIGVWFVTSLILIGIFSIIALLATSHIK